ncbi:hypothetical protein D9611_004382 [Ephemerocybe angulata]|uniref:5-demethoxyubiquinone hydroxylase, mitochondrial n=1 Tax=Ephemerocybe angulata TaxID=980116 RepID=A0A8H5BJQ7_9AGAR|nr:hypothetical protein D9611_004382 [Tulosesus angulatus]
MLGRYVCRCSLRRQGLSVSRGLASSAYTNPTKAGDEATTTTPEDLTPHQRKLLEGALRVDQAGEIAANWIYHGQHVVLSRDRATGELIKEMWEQEKKHLAVMDKLQVQHNVRPTLLTDVAKVAGFGLGAVTALMGKEAAMACTEAVETVIGEHYEDQLKELDEMTTKHPSIPLLKGVIKEFKDDELEHLDIAVENHAQRAPAHALLSAVVGAGCMVAIEICKRV